MDLTFKLLKAVSASCATSAEFTLELFSSITLFISTDLRSIALVLLSEEWEGGRAVGREGGREGGRKGGRAGVSEGGW